MLAPLWITKSLLPLSCRCPACPHSCSVKLFPHSYRCWLNFVFTVCFPQFMQQIASRIVRSYYTSVNFRLYRTDWFQAMKIRHFLFFFNFHWFFFFSSSFLSFSDVRLCELFFFPLSIFLAFAIPSPTHACHRRSGGSSLISGAAKNRGRTREAERERVFAALMVRK